MNSEVAVILPSVMMSIMDLIILINVLRNRSETGSRRIFLHFTAAVLLAQLMSVPVLASSIGLFSMSQGAAWFVYIFLLITTVFAAYFWFRYLALSILNIQPSGLWEYTVWLLPTLVLFAASLLSPFTPLVMDIDAAGSYHRGMFYPLQLLCPYSYTLMAVALTIHRYHQDTARTIRKMLRYLALYVIPSSVGIALQLLVFQGGYIQIGTSVGLILMYLEQYVEEVYENNRLRSIQTLNAQLQQTNESLARQLSVTAATCSRYFCVYAIDMEKASFAEAYALPNMHAALGSGGDVRRALTAAWQQLVIAEDRQVMKQFHDFDRWQEFLAHRDICTCEYRGITQGWCRATLFAGQRDASGRVLRVVYTIEQIEEQKLAEQALSEQLKKITLLNQRMSEQTAIVSKAGLGIWYILLKDGQEPRMQPNEKMRQLLGIADRNMTEEAIYSSWYQRILPEDLASVQRSVAKIISGRFDENTYRWVHPKKGLIYVRCGGSAAKMPDGTTVLSGYHSEVTDIVLAEQQQKEQLLAAHRAAEKQNEALSRQLDIIQSIAQTYNSIYYVNLNDGSFTELGAPLKGVREIIGQNGTAQEAMDAMCRYIVVPEQAEELAEFTRIDTVRHRLQDRSWISHQFLGKLAGWSEGIFISAHRDENGQCDHVIWATRTINEDKQKELAYQKALEETTAAAQAANESKTQFLFNMSHDIRTPMNAITGYVNLMQLHMDDTQLCRDYLQKVKLSGDFLLSIINNVLEMARIESGKITLDEEALEVNTLSEELNSVYHDLMLRKGIRFELTCEVTDHYFYCDRVKISQIFLNLISNAYKYTPAGGTVRVDTLQLPGDDPDRITLQTTVADTGIGMSEEFLKQIFEPFSREHTATENRIEGTGLGMSIVKKLVDFMGGTITVASRPGEGTTFTVTLSHRRAEAAELRQGEDFVPDCSSFAGRRILLAEDNDLNAEIAQALLEEYGLLSERARDGVECVEMLKKAEVGCYDLILMDVQMPRLDGYGAARQIRALEDTEKAGIPIIAMTANAFSQDRSDALAAGMNDHLAKPIDIPALLKALSAVLG